MKISIDVKEKVKRRINSSLNDLFYKVKFGKRKLQANIQRCSKLQTFLRIEYHVTLNFIRRNELESKLLVIYTL